VKQKRTSKRTASKRATKKSAASKRARPARPVAARGRKPAASKRGTKRTARGPARPGRRPARAARASRTGPRDQRVSAGGRWLAFVERHGVVLASARGPVPSVAEAVAGQPIIGSWWAHPRGKAIFAALSEIDDADDVRCFKLVDGKVTFVHRRMWPALARLASDGILAAARVASIQQEHMPTGEHRNLVTPFPDWVPDDVARAASALSVDDARAQLGGWV